LATCRAVVYGSVEFGFCLRYCAMGEEDLPAQPPSFDDVLPAVTGFGELQALVRHS